jgi:tetratricopeptide (TPR) repeat protein
LQKKKDDKNPNSLIIHGIQATFFAYLAANLFSFDVFSTYLIFFLIVAYSLSLIKKPEPKEVIQEIPIEVKEKELKPGKPLFLSLLLIILISFIWFGALKPLGINEKINWVNHYVRTKQCQKAVEKMETEVLPANSVINSFAKLKYIEVVENCNVVIPGLKKALAPKTIPVLEEVKEIRPYYTRTWIFLGKYTNILIENKEVFKVKNVDELKKQADEYFERASQLSPSREDIIMGQIQGDIIQKDYLEAKEKINQCLQLNPKAEYCWWLKILASLYLNEIEQVHKDMEIAAEKGFNLISERNLYQFKMICEETESKECFKELVDILYSLNVYEGYRYSSEHHFNLINISIKGEKEEILKETIKNILGTWPELETELRDYFDSIDEINIKIVNQYIDNTEKLMKTQKDLMNSNIPKQEITDIIKSKEEYKINQELKLIK